MSIAAAHFVVQEQRQCYSGVSSASGGGFMEIPNDVRKVHEDWQGRGRFITLAEGHRIFTVQVGRGPDLVLVHGFPSTSHDFAAALPFLTPRFRVTTWDHLGFGFSDKPAGDVSYSLLDQGRRAGEIARALGVEQARVVGHDMGLTIAVEMLCRQEEGTIGFRMQTLVLCNGSHLVELAQLTAVQQALMTDDGAAAFAQSFDAERFAQGLRFVWADAARTPEIDLRAIAYWMARDGGLDVLGRIARYNLERRQYAERWRSILGRTDVPIQIVWGDRDPIAVFEIAKRLAEMSRGPLTVLEGIGHYPQMEAPEAWAAAVVRATQSTHPAQTT
jgi:pimeloyl-ACP methyl ester carboxylesterase